MASYKTVRFESPASEPFLHDKASQNRKHEPHLRVDQIQGNIFSGFLKDHQTLLFLRIDDRENFRKWLSEFVPRIARMADVVAFSRMFKSLRRQQGEESTSVQSTWVNIAFSWKGLKELETAGMKLHQFKDAAFKAGMAARSRKGLLGDPAGKGCAGDPTNWVIGGPGREADVILIVGGDRRNAVNDEVSDIEASLFRRAGASESIQSGASLLFRQNGDILIGPLAGHEHFGFRDGISQPGIRGLLPDDTPLTPSQNPLDPNQGKPGQDLLWPGEFVFGYPGQDPNKEVEDEGIDPLDNPQRKAPEFARDGSFLVFRRLRQDVGRFHRFLVRLADRFETTPELVGSRMVGRWASGAPAVVTPEQDDTALAGDDCRNNNFEYGLADPAGKPKPTIPTPEMCHCVTPPPNDPRGSRVPFAGHIRKAYPRNDTSSTIHDLKEETSQAHRLLRRGLPYGSQSSSSLTLPVDDSVDRGLLFLAYQTSIVDQFEFVTSKWANNPNFKQGGVGFDPIIGQNDKPGENRRRTFHLKLRGETQPIETDEEWVIPTGGGYFFSPSIAGLQTMAAGDTATTGKAKAAAKKAPRKKKTRK